MTARSTAVVLAAGERTPQEWADYCRDGERDGVAATIEWCRRIFEAKQRLQISFREWADGYYTDYKYAALSQLAKVGENADKLFSIAKHREIANDWTALHLLSRLPDDEVAAIEGPISRATFRAAKENKREVKRKENAAKVAKAGKPLKQSFSTIVIDPPWDWGDEGDVNQMGRAKPDYHTLPLDEITALPVGEYAAEDAHLYLWITNRSLPKGFALLDAWGFRYVTCLTWVKPSFGMGNYFRGQTEHVLFGVRGSLSLKRKDAGTVFHAPRGEVHSAKPAEFFDLIESCSHAPYLEMFSRTARDGWICWGEDSAD